MSRPHKSSSTPAFEDLKKWSLIADFLAELDTHLPGDLPKKPGGPTRLLLPRDYLASFLFALVNPQLDSMRALCAASHIKQVQQQVCKRPMSLGSFSDAQHVLDASLLEQVFLSLARSKLTEELQENPASPETKRLIKLVDSTVLRALPRMEWAEWRHQNKTQRCARLHILWGQSSHGNILLFC